jgi:hypothetical protein
MWLEVVDKFAEVDEMWGEAVDKCGEVDDKLFLVGDPCWFYIKRVAYRRGLGEKLVDLVV